MLYHMAIIMVASLCKNTLGNPTLQRQKWVLQGHTLYLKNLGSETETLSTH